MDDPRTAETIRSPSFTGLDPVVSSLIVLALVLAITALRSSVVTATAGPLPPALATINPNTAPWWELMVLPDIGEATARMIVEYRDGDAGRRLVFQKPADLEAVPGIGPKTIQHIAPYLHFDD